MMKKTINLEVLTKHLGKPEKQVGSEYIWQCPYCKDSHRDNLKFNDEKGVLWCFANNEHAPKVLKDIFKNKDIRLNSPEKTPVENKEIYLLDNYRQENFEGRTYFSNLRLLKDEEMLNFLFKKRGLTSETVEKVKIGIEYDGTWRIPTFQYSTDGKRQVMGFEYRPKDLSKVGLYREKNTPTGLAMINEYTENTEILVIVEGYFDGYALWQHLNEQGIDEYYHILTPSNGVNSLYKYILQIDFNKYKEHMLFLDNDEAGQKMSLKIKETFPMFKIIRFVGCDCKDFNEHYLKCIKGLP